MIPGDTPSGPVPPAAATDWDAAGARPDPGAVVDPQLRVNGLSGLRIADAGIMPTIVSGNTHAPVTMIAEKASEMILAEAR